MAVPTITSGALRKLLAVAEEHGTDRGAILRDVGLAPAVVDDPDARIPISTLHRCWELVVAKLPDLNVEVATAYSVGDYGIVGFVAMNSASLAEALAHCARYVGLWADAPSLVLDGPTMRFEYRHRFADGVGLRRATEAAPIEIIHAARLLTQRRIVPRAVKMAHAAPPHAARYEAFFGCAVRFGAKDNALVLAQEDLSAPLVKADPQLGVYLRGVANDALAERSRASDSLIDHAKQIIAEGLQQGVPSIDVVVDRIGTSERTLRRRLADRGTSFRDLLDDTRSELAQSYVGDDRMPLAEVAFMLGFSEPSAFHRAFKRWTRTTPAAWRASCARATRASTTTAGAPDRGRGARPRRTD